MHVKLTNEAAAALSNRLGDRPGALRIVYDTEGCGCAVNGVPALWIVDMPERGDLNVASEPIEVWIDPNHLIFFESSLKLDYRADVHRFRLYSDNQIYNAALAADDRRTAPVNQR